MNVAVITLMNLDEFIANLKLDSTDAAVSKLATLLCEWKLDSSDVNQLCSFVERYFGNCWIGSTEQHDNLHRQWLDFKRDAIDTIDGQTMNERLYWFGLHDQFDGTSTTDARNQIYSKLLASPQL